MATEATTKNSPPSDLSRQEIEVLLAQLASEITRDSAHVYTTPVGELPSVTTIIRCLDKPALVPWASKMQSEACEAAALEWLQSPPEERGDLLKRLTACRQAHRKMSKKAADAGTEGHKLAEYEFRRKLGLDAVKPEIEHPKEAYAVCAGIMEWAKENDLEPVSVEPYVYSRKYAYAGAADLYAYLKGKFTVLDWKSSESGRIYREAYLQNHALRGALKEHGIEAEGCVVGVPRNGQGDINPVMVAWRDTDFIAFRGLMAVHRWQQIVG